MVERGCNILYLVVGFLAQSGYLQLPWLVIFAFAATFVADQAMFQLGKRSGDVVLAQRPQWQGRADRARRLFEAHQIPVVLGFRFLYGCRMVTPFVIGMSGFNARLFVCLSAVSGFLWAVLVAGLGYSCGALFEIVVADIKKYEIWALLAVATVGCGIWLTAHCLRCRRQKVTPS